MLSAKYIDPRARSRRQFVISKKTLDIASSDNQVDQVFWLNLVLAEVFSEERKFGGAQTHLERIKSLAANNTYLLAYAEIVRSFLRWIEGRQSGHPRRFKWRW